MKIGFRNLLLVTALALASKVQAELWQPNDATGITLTVWYDASDLSTLSVTNISGTNYVTQWNDKSDNNNHLTQTNSALRLTTSNASEYINGSNTVVSVRSITNTMSTTTAIPRNTGNTALFWVARMDTASGVNGIIQPSAAINNRFGLNGNNKFDYRFHGYNLALTFSTETGQTWDSGETHIGEVYEESGNMYGGITGYLTTTPLLIGSGSSTGWDRIPSYSYDSAWGGAIAEIIIITGDAVPEAERQKLEGYLAWKWGIEANLPAGHPYIAGAPTIPGPAGTVFTIR